MNCRLAFSAASLLSIVLTSGAYQIFDSAEEFSGTQSQDNWYYGYYDGNSAFPFSSSDFEEMPVFTNNATWIIHRGDRSGYWTSLSANGGHPNGPVGNYYQGTEHWPVRRWVAEIDGTILIEGNLRKSSSRYGDGIIGHILLNDDVVFSQRIYGNDLTGVDYSIQVDVNVGDTIDFAIQPVSNDQYDSTYFTAIGTVINEITNEPPVANAGPDLIEYDEVIFDAYRSYDPDGTLVAYEWQIVSWSNPNQIIIKTDEAFALENIPAGFYNATLTVTDDGGLSDSDEMTLAVKGPAHICEFTAEDVEFARNEGYAEGYTNGIAATTATYDPNTRIINIPALESGGRQYGVKLSRRGNSNLFAAIEGSEAFPKAKKKKKPSKCRKGFFRRFFN